MATQRCTTLRVEVVKVILDLNVALCGNGPTVGVMSTIRPVKHLALHLINIFLRVFDHLNGLLRLFFECCLSLFNLLLLNLYPSIDLLLLKLETSW